MHGRKTQRRHDETLNDGVTNNRSRKRAMAGLAAGLLVGLAPFASWAADASQLGASLTPVGGEKAGNKDGSIPAWQPERQDAGWTPGKFRGDGWKHKADKPLFSINASNVDKYADKLTPGQIALIKQTSGYKMEVYPTRRSCGVPDFVAENTKKNVGVAEVGADGWSLKEAILPGTPFPIPRNGIEAMWNLKMHYRGAGFLFKNATTNVSPRKGGTEWITATYDETFFMPWGMKGSRKLSEMDNTYSHVYYGFNAPAALAGQGGIITDFVNQPGTESYYYFPGQRRVRRLPSYAYDAPTLGFENQYAIDEAVVFSGALDRFDWKLAGKKEIYVPYNSFGAYDFAGKQFDILQRDFVDPNHRHYELHRVWVVEATVKAGVRHISPKRTYYLDEDSWNPVLAEDYDGQNRLWKVREGYLIPVFEIGACDVAAFAQYNLAEGRYVADFHTMGTGTDPKWTMEAAGPTMKPGFYTADNLRAISDR